MESTKCAMEEIWATKCAKFFSPSTVFCPFNIQLDLYKKFSSKLCVTVFDRRKLIESGRLGSGEIL
jgi:hypothetical protein